MKTVLMIEDNPVDVLLLRQAFKRAHFAVELKHCEDAEQAGTWLVSRIANREPMPGLIIVDLNLPMVDGMDVLVGLRSVSDLKDTPIVMYSSSTRPEDMAQAKSRAASYYFVKPTSPQDFAQLVSVLEELVTWPDQAGWNAKEETIED